MRGCDEAWQHWAVCAPWVPHDGGTEISTEKLTNSRVKNATAPPGGRMELWDELLPGLGLRVSGSGTKTWFVRYRFGANQRRLKIGAYPSIMLADARRLARSHMLS